MVLREIEEEFGLEESSLNVMEYVKKILNYEVWGKLKIVIYWVVEVKDYDEFVQFFREYQDFKWFFIDRVCDFLYDIMGFVLCEVDEELWNKVKFYIYFY